MRKKYTVARAKYKKSLHLAEVESNGVLINSAPNKVKKAWEIINAQKKTPVPKDDYNISADDFNSYFISSVAEV
ncbi:hypothetical protein J6590_068708 [Homalodisca vitripennis]|nr:hypothetical protein J6590_068708 [Homalodisca vitripennis]